MKNTIIQWNCRGLRADELQLLLNDYEPAVVCLQETYLKEPNNVTFRNGECGGSVVECRTPEREVRGSRPTSAVLCP